MRKQFATHHRELVSADDTLAWHGVVAGDRGDVESAQRACLITGA